VLVPNTYQGTEDVLTSEINEQTEHDPSDEENKHDRNTDRLMLPAIQEASEESLRFEEFMKKAVIFRSRYFRPPNYDMPENGEIKILGTHTALVRDPNRDVITSGRNSICIMECPKDSA